MPHTDLDAAEPALSANTTGSSIERATESAADRIPLHRLGAPEDVAEVIM